MTRTVFALLIAISVALLPAAGGAALNLAPADHSEMSDMSAAAGAMDDCCPPDVNPCKGMDGCASMASCALQSFSMTGAADSFVVYAPPSNRVLPPLQTAAAISETGSPPFRPPRV